MLCNCGIRWSYLLIFSRNTETTITRLYIHNNIKSKLSYLEEEKCKQMQAKIQTNSKIIKYDTSRRLFQCMKRTTCQSKSSGDSD